jgi:hypothetical protein
MFEIATQILAAGSTTRHRAAFGAAGFVIHRRLRRIVPTHPTTIQKRSP